MWDPGLVVSSSARGPGSASPGPGIRAVACSWPRSRRRRAPPGSGLTTRNAAVSSCAESFDRYPAGSGRRAVTLPVWPGRIEGRMDSRLWLATIVFFSHRPGRPRAATSRRTVRRRCSRSPRPRWPSPGCTSSTCGWPAACSPWRRSRPWRASARRRWGSAARHPPCPASSAWG